MLTMTNYRHSDTVVRKFRVDGGLAFNRAVAMLEETLFGFVYVLEEVRKPV
ncbi:MAG TPA: hypothetical protein VF271_05080 [Rhodanobacteraceae bacterium]